MSSNYYKFYSLLRLLQAESDENHILTMKDIREKLQHISGEKIDRRTIYDYLDVLNNLGYEISDYNENGKGYYLRGRDFEEYEVRILMDLVSACRSVTHTKTKELVEKLENFNSKYVTDKLKGQLYIDNRSKSNNEHIFYSISNINEAILTNKKINFNYYHFDANKELVPRMENGNIKLYTINPVAMILKKDSYYLIGFSHKKTKPTHYRIDRMQMVVLTDEERTLLNQVVEFKEGFDAAAYSKKCINMYTGDDCSVLIEFRNSLLDAVIDELGEDVELRKVDDENFTARFIAKNSTGLIRWIMQYGSSVKVIEPVALVENIKKQIEEMKALYG